MCADIVADNVSEFPWFQAKRAASYDLMVPRRRIISSPTSNKSNGANAF
jgi:hypothetical protein